MKTQGLYKVNIAQSGSHSKLDTAIFNLSFYLILLYFIFYYILIILECYYFSEGHGNSKIFLSQIPTHLNKLQPFLG